MTEALLSFGPVAFGTVIVVVLWRVIIQPELNQRRLEMQALQAQIENITLLHQQIKSTADSVQLQTQILAGLIETQRSLVTDLTRLADCKRAG